MNHHTADDGHESAPMMNMFVSDLPDPVPVSEAIFHQSRGRYLYSVSGTPLRAFTMSMTKDIDVDSDHEPPFVVPCYYILHPVFGSAAANCSISYVKPSESTLMARRIKEEYQQQMHLWQQLLLQQYEQEQKQREKQLLELLQLQQFQDLQPEQQSQYLQYLKQQQWPPLGPLLIQYPLPQIQPQQHLQQHYQYHMSLAFAGHEPYSGGGPMAMGVGIAEPEHKRRCQSSKNVKRIDPLPRIPE